MLIRVKFNFACYRGIISSGPTTHAAAVPDYTLQQFLTLKDQSGDYIVPSQDRKAVNSLLIIFFLENTLLIIIII